MVGTYCGNRWLIKMIYASNKFWLISMTHWKTYFQMRPFLRINWSILKIYLLAFFAKEIREICPWLWITALQHVSLRVDPDEKNAMLNFNEIILFLEQSCNWYFTFNNFNFNTENAQNSQCVNVWVISNLFI